MFTVASREQYMSRAAGERSVLVVDDESAVRTMLRGYLEAVGYRTHVAANGEEALRLVEEERPDLVLLDVRMPGMDGLDVLARIKEIDSRIAVVLMSGYATVGVAASAMKLGAETVLVKPLSIAELDQALDAVMSRRDASAGGSGVGLLRQGDEGADEGAGGA
jgi:CheY-like chemotaxis protein